MKPPTTPREMIAHLQHELSVANNWIEHHQNHVDDLIKENAALRDTVEQWKCRYYDVADAICRESNGIEDLCRQARALRAENIALRTDKERLDWLSSQKDQPWLYWERPLRFTREAIDAFRKEAQP